MALKSVLSQNVEVTTLEKQLAPAEITDIRAYNAEEGKLTLVWTAPTAEEGVTEAAVAYKIGRVVDGALGEDAVEVTELTHVVYVLPGITIVDLGIVAVDADGEESAVTMIPAVDTKPSAPTIEGTSNAAGEVTITATIDKIDGKNGNVDAIEIFRKDGEDFVAVNTAIEINKVGEDFVATISGLAEKQLYTFAAVAVHTAGIEAAVPAPEVTEPTEPEEDPEVPGV